jgi:hypothetical protein
MTIGFLQHSQEQKADYSICEVCVQTGESIILETYIHFWYVYAVLEVLRFAFLNVAKTKSGYKLSLCLTN